MIVVIMVVLALTQSLGIVGFEVRSNSPTLIQNLLVRWRFISPMIETFVFEGSLTAISS
jgi:hypothetical protein